MFSVYQLKLINFVKCHLNLFDRSYLCFSWFMGFIESKFKRIWIEIGGIPIHEYEKLFIKCLEILKKNG
jgi:hypothetical protein